jgi:hypothetical protein
LKSASFPKLARAAFIIIVYLALLGIFWALKWSYHDFYPLRDYRDSTSYALTAEQSLTSPAFWAGERSFTLPLLYKIVGVTSQNVKTPATMQVVAQWQTWISIFSWVIFGLTIARRFRQRWLGIVAFALILGFSLVYDVSRWDRMMLSESLSCSLLVLLLAGWIWLLDFPPAQSRSPLGILVLVWVSVISVLFAFIRDSNIYFVLIAAFIFAAAALLRRFQISRLLTLVYLGIIVQLFFAQNASISAGNRWQVFIYDHLAYRIIPNPAALDYFTKAGLPVSETLLQIPTMRGYVYQALLFNDPAMEPVRRWTNEHGKATYLGYLLSDLGSSLSQPLDHAALLLNGTMEYGDPDHARLFPTFPDSIQVLTNALFSSLSRSRRYMALGYILMLALSTWALLRGWGRGVWGMLFAVLVSIYPLMFLNWHGDPMEIERHGLQIAIQFRLAFWLILLLGLDHAIQRVTAIPHKEVHPTV